MTTQNFTYFDVFQMHADMSDVRIQTNKIVPNEVKRQQSNTIASLCKKPNKLFGQPSTIDNMQRRGSQESTLAIHRTCP